MTRHAGRRICIITPGYISSTPRVVREADALTTAGYDVRVVFTQGQLEAVRQFDCDVLKRKAWRTSVFTWSDRDPREWWAYQRTRIRHGVARALPSTAWQVAGVIERAEGRVYPELARLAALEPADLYIGHYPIGLAAACAAAQQHGAAAGYDIEDLYADTLETDATPEKARARILRIERRYVPRCSLVTAVSGSVADVFADRLGTTRPIVVHNCHSWGERADLDGLTLQRRGASLSLYWFSQTVGLNRGIQDAIRAAGLTKAPLEIHLQGSASEDVQRRLTTLAHQCGVGRSLFFHDSVPPSQLASRAAEHDVGLALEQGHSVNNRLTASNKIFLYLVTGLAVAATDTDGQREVLGTAPLAGTLYSPGDHESLASTLSAWARDPQALRATKQASLDAGRETWNWELESRKLLAGVDEAIDRHRTERAL